MTAAVPSAPATRRADYPVLLRAEHVCLQFGRQVVLRDVDATITDLPIHGQVVGFLGPSGCGKTSLCRVMAGLQEPTSGRVMLGSQGTPVRAGDVGYVQQNYPLLMHRKVLGNLLVATRGPHREERARAMLERFGLQDHAHHYPAQLSGGQRQRVAIAQQLLCSDHFVILDEPFSGLDPIMSDAVSQLIKEVAEADSLNSMIVVTHDVSAAVAVADTIWLMGRDRERPGARLVAEVDLVERGLAWQPDVRQLPAFAETVRELRARFKDL